MQLFLDVFVHVIVVESGQIARCRLVGVGDFVFRAFLQHCDQDEKIARGWAQQVAAVLYAAGA